MTNILIWTFWTEFQRVLPKYQIKNWMQFHFLLPFSLSFSSFMLFAYNCNISHSGSHTDAFPLNKSINLLKYHIHTHTNKHFVLHLYGKIQTFASLGALKFSRLASEWLGPYTAYTQLNTLYRKTVVNTFPASVA